MVSVQLSQFLYAAVPMMRRVFLCIVGLLAGIPQAFATRPSEPGDYTVQSGPPIDSGLVRAYLQYRTELFRDSLPFRACYVRVVRDGVPAAHSLPCPPLPPVRRIRALMVDSVIVRGKDAEIVGLATPGLEMHYTERTHFRASGDGNGPVRWVFTGAQIGTVWYSR